MALVDIILPNFNKENYLQETIDSILEQSLKDFNLFIIDDNSTDNSIKVIDKYSDPRIKFSDIELNNDFNYSVEMLQYLKRKNSRINFIWIMGEDNLLTFHLWRNWQWIAKNYKIGVLARDNSRAAVNSSVFASKFKHFRLHSRNSIALMSARAPAWCIVNTKKRRVSSTDLRSDV